MRKTIISMLWVILIIAGPASLVSHARNIPGVLSIKERAAVINQITKMRLDELLPKVM